MTKKDTMVEKTDARMKQIDATIARFKARVEGAEPGMKIEMEKAFAALKKKRTAFGNRVAELRNASDGTVADLEDSLERAWTALSDSVHRAIARFERAQDADIDGRTGPSHTRPN